MSPLAAFPPTATAALVHAAASRARLGLTKSAESGDALRLRYRVAERQVAGRARLSAPWAAHLGVNRTITALGIVARHAGLGLEPFVVRELPACRRTRDVSSCRGGPNGAADSQTAAKLAQGRVGPHARATQRSVGAGRRGTREKVLGSRLLYSPGQPRPSEKIGRASTRGVSKHKPGAFELTLS